MTPFFYPTTILPQPLALTNRIMVGWVTFSIIVSFFNMIYGILLEFPNRIHNCNKKCNICTLRKSVEIT